MCKIYSLLTIFIFFCLTACAANVPHSVDFSSDSDQALILIGVQADPTSKNIGGLVNIVFSGLDSTTNGLLIPNKKDWFKLKIERPLNSVLRGDTLKSKLMTTQYYLLKVHPRTYALKAVINDKTTLGSSQDYKTCKFQNSFYFHATAGKVNFIGNFILKDIFASTGFIDLQQVGYNMEDALDYVRSSSSINSGTIKTETPKIQLHARCTRR